MFPVGDSCYHRLYSDDHLARHPDQRVTAMTIVADPAHPADPWPAVTVRVALRGGHRAEAVAYCQNIEATLYCEMEGDAGGFGVEVAKNGAVLVSVSRAGMGFETERDLVTLEARQGDDRSFLLGPARACR